MSALDASYARAVALIDDVEPRLDTIITEEDAKLQLIVRFFTEVLSWDHADLSAERKNDNGYSDYVVSDDNRPALVIEAKRQGALELATSAKSKSLYKISGPALKKCIDGIEQAASYCAPDGIQLAVVTDGTTWIFFRPYIPNENYKTKEAIVFPNLRSIADDFASFFELASKEGYRGSLYKHIFDKIHDRRLLLTLGLHSAFTDSDIHPNQKSQIAFDLDRIFNSFFAGMAGESDPDMLIECFVETKESRIADFALEKLTTYVLGNISPLDKQVDESLQQLISSTITDKHGDTVFIVGPSGAGKTTFLERFFKATLPHNVRERCVVVNVNALDATGDTGTSPAWFTNDIISKIEKELYPKGFPNWDQLLGLYYQEYVKRSEGVDAELYKRDKNAFKEKFGTYMDERVEQDREGYLRRLLIDIVENRKRLPIFVVDNTDEFSAQFKETLFQYFQSLRRHVTHCLLLFPLTDRSAWAFSKTEIFNIYSSKSYFLPTPPPREIFRKRLEYLKAKIKPTGKTAGVYDAGNFRVKLESLEAFASAIEDIFVLQDYISNRLGSLANYNIRRTLALARRVITSSALNIEDLLRSYVAGDQQPLSADRFMLTLILGDYNFYKRGDAHSVFPMFDVSTEIAQSPLLNVRILGLLKATHDARSSDDSRYLSTASIAQYFDGMGFAETAVESALSSLMQASLVEAHDPSKGNLAPSQGAAITYSGLTHLELALYNPIYFEQMALTAIMANADIAKQIRGHAESSEAIDVRMKKVRETFAAFLIDEDSKFGRVPESSQYKVQKEVTADILKFSGGTSEAELSTRDAVKVSAKHGVVIERANAVVDWFDENKGYGFAAVEQLGESAFLHASVLSKSGVGSVHDGDVMVVDVSRGPRGISISNVHRTQVAHDAAAKLVDAVVIKIFEDRGYGFVHVPSMGQDAFFHVSILPEQDRASFELGATLKVELNIDPRGRGLQVRRVLTAATA
ncbi:cold shock domain-containing protein [Bradyrhizobium sp. WD16]|uniref:cold shock domain-containing protein n=1 Tax=Bradyrhizobium sp. WD16 TaxID=1521768 RepID=UPI0020A48EEA|nr:cold shock domain-containing protein [Bradyrhizobium sp. WD16]UTD29162.1 ATPase [Bradyrhizobium sp. WD16]